MKIMLRQRRKTLITQRICSNSLCKLYTINLDPWWYQQIPKMQPLTIFYWNFNANLNTNYCVHKTLFPELIK